MMCSSDLDADGDGLAARPDPRLNLVLDALSDPVRRAVLYFLREADEEVASIDDLADAIVTLDVDVGDRDRAVVALHHQHLPHLETAGCVAYDPRSGDVRYEAPELLERLLPVLESAERA